MTVREPISIGDARGFRYAELGADLLRNAPAWIEARAVPDGEEIRPGRLYRWSRFAIKFYGRPRGSPVKDRLGPSPAIKSADRHAAILPLRSPRPVLAVDRGRGSRHRTGLFVYEWVDGRFLDDLGELEDDGVLTFPPFMARMHEAGIFHGDFHLRNFLYDGEDWNLLDLDGLRHRFRNLWPARLAEDDWSRVWFGLDVHCGAGESDVRTLFDAYLRETRILRDGEASWARIHSRLERHRAGLSPGLG